MRYLGSKNQTILSSITACVFALTVGACVPQKSSSSSSSKDDSAATAADAIAINGMRVGPSAVAAETDSLGNYFSRFTPLTANGSCKGNVGQVKIEYTPTAGVTTAETVTCSGSSFSWTKSLTTETLYTLVFTALDGSGTAISSVAPLNRTYTYDITLPGAPQFVSPTTGNTYTITDGTQNITIAGQVLKEVTKLVGPYSTILPTMLDADNIHRNFIYSAVVPVGVTSNFEFTAYDAAGNERVSNLAITSTLELSIPVAKLEIGGSTVKPNMTIESTIGVMSEVVLDQNVVHSSGSAGIIGSIGDL